MPLSTWSGARAQYSSARQNGGFWAMLKNMQRGVVVRGRLHGRLIELDERMDALEGEVEVVVRPADATPRPPDVLEVIATLPAGTRTKDDIDRQLHEDRSGWAGRG
jgi:hypothetical protein